MGEAPSMPKRSLTLTHSDGKFVFSGNLGDLPWFGSNEDCWTATADGCVTTDYKAAAALKRYADERARKILNRAFVKRYPLTRLPLPTFLDAHQHDGV